VLEELELENDVGVARGVVERVRAPSPRRRLAHVRGQAPVGGADLLE
jgi:hypothetical protein